MAEQKKTIGCIEEFWRLAIANNPRIFSKKKPQDCLHKKLARQQPMGFFSGSIQASEIDEIINQLLIFILFKNFNKFNLDFLSNEKSYLYKLFVAKDSPFKKFAFTLARYSYGIYLIHTAILSILYRSISISHFSYTSYFLTLFILDVIISVLVMSILSRVPHVKDWIGAK
jgi:hypothetical protein